MNAILLKKSYKARKTTKNTIYINDIVSLKNIFLQQKNLIDINEIIARLIIIQPIYHFFNIQIFYKNEHLLNNCSTFHGSIKFPVNILINVYTEKKRQDYLHLANRCDKATDLLTISFK